MADNSEWLDTLHYIPFLREYGRHFSVNRMLGFESVKQRLDREQPLSFLEFNYMVLQAYDFLELGRRYGCRVQMGGSDQWGNIVCGVELGRRVGRPRSVRADFAAAHHRERRQDGQDRGRRDLAQPRSRLARTSTGSTGETRRTRTWGVSSVCSRSCRSNEIARLEALDGAEINEAKAILATEATTLCHGREAAGAAAETARSTFGPSAGTPPGHDAAGAGAPRRPAFEGPATGARGAPGLPSIEISRTRLDEGVPACDLLREAGLAKSNSEARRLIRGGGARVNDVRVEEETAVLGPGDVASGGAIKLSAGRKRHALVRVS